MMPIDFGIAGVGETGITILLSDAGSSSSHLIERGASIQAHYRGYHQSSPQLRKATASFSGISTESNDSRLTQTVVTSAVQTNLPF